MKSAIYEFEDYRKTLECAGPKLKEIVLDQAEGVSVNSFGFFRIILMP